MRRGVAGCLGMEEPRSEMRVRAEEDPEAAKRAGRSIPEGVGQPSRTIQEG